jgi:type I restriction enzyme M protein
MSTLEFTVKTKSLIDGLKRVCADYGLGNDGNEFKIITQVFLYKFLNDKFAHQVKAVDPKLAKSDNWEKTISAYNTKEYDMLLLKLGAKTAKLDREHFLSYLASKQNSEEFAKLFDDTLRDIAIKNNEIFSVKTSSGVKVKLFDELSQYIHDPSKRDDFCRALVNQLVDFSFERTFDEKFDFFSTIFEYLIKDYNKDGGGKYAEYYTPHAVAKIMASVLVNEKVSNVTIYDPSAGSGTLLMNLAHAIGEDRCTIYSQDISQKSSSLLRLNLILNDLVHSIQNVVVDNTILMPAHKVDNKLRTFEYVVSNPPFKLDFSDFRDKLDTPANKDRFFAGIPKITPKSPEKMAIYLLFIQHIMFSLSATGKAAVVVPTGFLTAQKGIEFNIRERMVKEKMLHGVVSMPSNIFATTGTNVSIIFLDKTNKKGNVVLMDASKLGETIKDGKNNKTLLSRGDEQLIIKTFNEHKAIEDFSAVVSYSDLLEKGCSFSAGQYFDVKIEHIDITQEEFDSKIKSFSKSIDGLFEESAVLENEIKKQLAKLKYD